jgi:hypothetical protein
VIEFRKIARGEGQARDPARIDVKRSPLTKLYGSRLVNEQILARSLCALKVDLRGGVENDCVLRLRLVSVAKCVDFRADGSVMPMNWA